MDGDLQSTFTKTLLERCNLKKDALDNARYESREKGQSTSRLKRFSLKRV